MLTVDFVWNAAGCEADGSELFAWPLEASYWHEIGANLVSVRVLAVFYWALCGDWHLASFASLAFGGGYKVHGAPENGREIDRICCPVCHPSPPFL